MVFREKNNHNRHIGHIELSIVTYVPIVVN